MPPERNQVGIAVLDDLLGSSGFKAPGCDDCPFNIFRSRAAAIAYRPSAMTTFLLTRGSMICR
jgi:hypothetical protein